MTDKDPEWLKDGRKDKKTFDEELKKTGDGVKAVKKVQKQVKKRNEDKKKGSGN